MSNTYSPGEAIKDSFTTRNPATGAGTAATGTPTGVLYRNNVATAVTVTIALVTGNIYSVDLTFPALGASLALGDTVSLQITATVSGVSDTGTLFTGRIAYPVTADSTGRVTLIPASITAIWDLATSGMATAGSIGKRIVDNLNAVVGNIPTTAAPTADTVAAAILVTPANKLATDASGRITQAPGDKVNYSLSTAPPTAGDIADAVRIELDPELDDITAIRTNTNKLTDVTASQLEIALKQFTNRVTVVSNVLTVYDDDETTVLETFTLTPISGNAGYSERTP